MAAKNNNRKYIGFEIDKTYYEYAKKCLTNKVEEVQCSCDPFVHYVCQWHIKRHYNIDIEHI